MNLETIQTVEYNETHKIECVDKKKNEYKYIGSIKKNPGHILFSFNKQTKEIKPAQFKSVMAVGYDGNRRQHTLVSVESDCYYDQALNRKNFIKRLKRKGLL